MAMAQTAFRTRRTLSRSRLAAASESQRAEMPLFQAFLRPSSVKVTDGLCIKDAATIDPARGSGNFLTETYISIRRLENEALNMLNYGQMSFVTEQMNLIKVSIGQFYGIEINDFAVTVAKTALWIAESQMMKETEDVVHTNLEFLPLKGYVNIIEGNALRLDWEKIVSKNELNYIMGNPPFVGYAYQTKKQKDDLRNIRKCISMNIDYVAGGYFKAGYYMQNTNIRTAFVSTNSITQGEQVFAIWKQLITEYQIHNYFLLTL